MPLSLGLNVSKKPTPATNPKLAPRRPIGLVDDDSDDDTEQPPAQNGRKRVGADAALETTTFDDTQETSLRSGHPEGSTQQQSNSAPSSAKPKASKSKSDIAPTLSSTVTARRLEKDALDQDATIYDYDAHYETSSSAAMAAQRRAASQQEARTRTPKYMTNMKAAATQRQRDYLRAEDKRLQREREEDPEGEKEAFVTGAYKARQAEAQKLEKEEKMKELEEEKRRSEGGMGGFWKGVMDEDEKRRIELAEKGAEGRPEVREELDKEKEIAEQARRLNEKGANIQINEDGLVADKRQLLTAGLNVAAKPTGANAVPEKDRARAEHDDASRPAWDTKEKRDARKAIGERHARMMEHQLEQASKRKAEEQAEELQKREMDSKSKKTDKDISSAKERYLQRKKEAEERKRLGLED